MTPTPSERNGMGRVVHARGYPQTKTGIIPTEDEHSYPLVSGHHYLLQAARLHKKGERHTPLPVPKGSSRSCLVKFKQEQCRTGGAAAVSA